MGTRRYILGKIFQVLLTLAFVMVFNFFLFRMIPGDPSELLLQGTYEFDPQNVEEVTQDLGLDKPLPQQFLVYVRDTLVFNFGDSYAIHGQDVKRVISQRIWPTLLLVVTSTVASAAIGLLIGIYGGWRRGSRFDRGSQGFTLFVYSMPEFWFGILMLMAFAQGVGPLPSLFPAGGYSTPGSANTGLAHVADVLHHLALPWFVLTVSFIGEYALIMRNSLIGVTNDHFVTTARAKGLREKQILWLHVVPNALLPTFTIVLLSIGYLRRCDHDRIRVLLARPGVAHRAGDRCEGLPAASRPVPPVLGRGARREPHRRHRVRVPRPKGQGLLIGRASPGRGHRSVASAGTR